MVDFLTKAERSARMARITSRDTQPEIMLRHELHARGLRFRLHKAVLPGKPDIVFPRYGTVVFVHGCFWHRHKYCNIATTPKSNIGFWKEKFDRNIKRDARVRRELRNQGWRVFTAWECQVQSRSRAARVADKLAWKIRSGAA
jgi:DNA mismatch endonuclease, patch repair protein